MPTSKEELLRKLAEIQAELAHCDCGGNESPVFIPTEEEEDSFYIDGIGSQEGSVINNLDYSSAYIAHRPTFRHRENAASYASAFETMIALRAAKGVVPMVHGAWQYLIEGYQEGGTLQIRKRRDAGVKQSRCFSPVFETEGDAQAAIARVGSDRIIRAMKVLAWG